MARLNWSFQYQIPKGTKISILISFCCEVQTLIQMHIFGDGGHCCPNPLTLAALQFSTSRRELGSQFMRICRNETSVLWFTLLPSVQAYSQESSISSVCDAFVCFPDPRAYLSASQPPKSNFPVKPFLVPWGMFPKIPKYKLNISWTAYETKMSIAMSVDQKWLNIYHFTWLSLQCTTLAAPASHISKPPRSLTLAHQDQQGSVCLP